MNRRIAILGCIAALILLLGAGRAWADFNPFNVYYDNIARAAADNDANKVRQLVTSGNSPNETDEETRSGLHVAALKGNLSIAAILIKAKARLDITDKLGNTPLMMAARRGDLELVSALLAKGANARKTDFTGRDALGWASDSRRPLVVQALQRAAATKR